MLRNTARRLLTSPNPSSSPRLHLTEARQEKMTPHSDSWPLLQWLQMCLVTGFQPPLAVATARNYIRALECWDKSVSAEKAAKCPLACRYHDAPSSRANSPSPLYWAKLSGAVVYWTWRTARWSLHKAGALASPEQTAPYGSADVQSSWEAAEDSTVTPSAWQRQEFCTPMCSHPGSYWQGGQSWTNNPGASLDHPSP